MSDFRQAFPNRFEALGNSSQCFEPTGRTLLSEAAGADCQLRSSGGTMPPFSASLAMTCLCSQMFMVAESLVSPE